MMDIVDRASRLIQGHLELLSPEDISAAAVRVNTAINAGESKVFTVECQWAQALDSEGQLVVLKALEAEWQVEELAEAAACCRGGVTGNPHSNPGVSGVY